MGQAPACIALLVRGEVGRLSTLLSAVVLLMIGCFSLIVARNGVPPALVGGLVPSIPDGAAETSLSLMGTTAVVRLAPRSSNPDVQSAAPGLLLAPLSRLPWRTHPLPSHRGGGAAPQRAARELSRARRGMRRGDRATIA